MKTILYLDLDDTILLYALPIHNTVSFFHWCNENFTIRWLTRWCPTGQMNADQNDYLSKILQIPIDDMGKFSNPLEFRNSKAEAIDWNSKWIWVENDIFSQFSEDGYGLQTQNSTLPLDRRSNARIISHPNYYQTDLRLWNNNNWIESIDVHTKDNAISRTWIKLQNRFNFK